MLSKCNLNERNLSIILHIINNNNIPNCNTSRISILSNKNTLCKRRVGILQVEDNNKEEYLVMEEANSFAITVGI